MKIQIKHRFTAAILFEHDAEDNSVKLTLQLAVTNKVDLRGANLSGADLSGADLRGADLRSAYLCDAYLRSAYLRSANPNGAYLRSANLNGANLNGANLSGAYLSGADLRSADLGSANLSGADLRSTYLSGADLRSAYLGSANLSGADLRSAYLGSANLQSIRADFYDVLSHAGREVPALIGALKNGRVDGSTYTGECACLVGTIANARGVDVHSDFFPIPRDASRPAERFFMGISKGDTPETNPASKIALEWAEAWLGMQQAAFGVSQPQAPSIES